MWIGSRVMSMPAKSRPMLTISLSASSVRRRGTFVMSSATVPSEAAALVDLGLLGARDHVARGELQLVGRVALEEALARGVEQPRALAARALGDQDPVARKRRRVELHHLHVLQRRADPERQRHPVAGHDQRVRGRLVSRPAPPEARIVDFALNTSRSAVEQVAADRADAAAIVVLEQLGREPLLVAATVRWRLISCS